MSHVCQKIHNPISSVVSDGKQLWVTSRWIQKVTVIDMDTRKVIKQIPVGKSPHGIFFISHAARK